MVGIVLYRLIYIPRENHMSSIVVRLKLYLVRKIHYQNIPQAPLKIFNRGSLCQGFVALKCIVVRLWQGSTSVNLWRPSVEPLLWCWKPGSFAVRYWELYSIAYSCFDRPTKEFGATSPCQNQEVTELEIYAPSLEVCCFKFLASFFHFLVSYRCNL